MHNIGTVQVGICDWNQFVEIFKMKNQSLYNNVAGRESSVLSGEGMS